MNYTDISFGGGGFHIFFHLGAVRAFHDFRIKTGYTPERVLGCSAGAIAGLLMFSDGLCEYLLDNIELFMPKDGEGMAELRDRLFSGMYTWLVHNDPKIYERCTGKLFIYATEVRKGFSFTPVSTHVFSSYTSLKDVFDAMDASSRLPIFISSTPKKINGKEYLDGGLLDLHPVMHPEQTLVISILPDVQFWQPSWKVPSCSRITPPGTSRVTYIWHSVKMDDPRLCYELLNEGYREIIDFTRKNSTSKGQTTYSIW